MTARRAQVLDAALRTAADEVCDALVQVGDFWLRRSSPLDTAAWGQGYVCADLQIPRSELFVGNAACDAAAHPAARVAQLPEPNRNTGSRKLTP